MLSFKLNSENPRVEFSKNCSWYALDLSKNTDLGTVELEVETLFWRGLLVSLRFTQSTE
jgi:hypothetical protein